MLWQRPRQLKGVANCHGKKQRQFKSDFCPCGPEQHPESRADKTSRTVHNAEINFRRHLCNVADDARPVESRSDDQNHILIAVVARELHGDKLTLWVLDGFTTLKYTHPHLCRSTVRRLMGKCAAEECVIGLIISVRSGMWSTCSRRRSHRSDNA